MKVLCLTSGLPTQTNPQMGVFVKEQVDSLRCKGVDMTTFVIKGHESPLNYLKAIFRLRQVIRRGVATVQAVHSPLSKGVRGLFSQSRGQDLNTPLPPLDRGEWRPPPLDNGGTERLRGAYDLVHAHYGYCGLVAHTQFVLPVVTSFHGGDILEDPSQKWPRALVSRAWIGLNKLLARRAGAVIVQSAEMKAELGLASALIIPFGVDLELFKPMDRIDACRQLNLPADRRRILFANNPSIPLKQFALAQRAFELARNLKPNTDLVVIGKEPRENVPLYMNACDVLILTSLFEGSPNVVKEAMACNLPIVSVDVGDVREVIGGAQNCFVTSRTSDEIARRIIQVFDSGRRSNGSELMANLGAPAIATRIVEVYESVLSR